MAFNSCISWRRLGPCLIVLGLLVLILSSACGGGGGGTGGTNGTTGVGNAINIAANAFFTGTQAQASGLGTSTFPYTLVPGDTAQIQLWGVNSVTGQPQQVTATGFSFVSPVPSPSVATLSSSGTLTAVGQSTGTYTVNVTYSGGSASFIYQIIPLGAKVTGFVTDTAQNAVAGTFVRFYSSNGLAILETVTGANGAFTVNVPPNTSTFTLDGSGLVGCNATTPSAPCYYTVYGYGGGYYSSIAQACYTALPALSSGKTTNLPYAAVMFPTNDSSSPPPPPTGCNG